MRVYRYTLWEDLRALYHLPEPLRKNNAPSVILIMAAVSESKGISCWRAQRIYRPRGGLGWLEIYKMFHWLPLTSLQYYKYRVMGLTSSVISQNMRLAKWCQLQNGNRKGLEWHLQGILAGNGNLEAVEGLRIRLDERKCAVSTFVVGCHASPFLFFYA